MSDIERAAFEEWYATSGRDPAWLTKRLDGTYTAPICQAPWEAWQARASRPVVVTDEMALQGAWAPINEFAQRMGIKPFDPRMAPDRNEIARARLILSAALNGMKT